MPPRPAASRLGPWESLVVRLLIVGAAALISASLYASIEPPRGYRGESFLREAISPPCFRRRYPREYRGVVEREALELDSPTPPPIPWVEVQDREARDVLTIIYSPIDEATGLLAFTTARREHRILFCGADGFSPRELAAARARFFDEVIRPNNDAPREVLERVRAGDFADSSALPGGWVRNGVLTAGVLLGIVMLVTTPRAVRRAFAAARAAKRSARNLCPRCAYSRAGLAPDVPCPECGSLPA